MAASSRRNPLVLLMLAGLALAIAGCSSDRARRVKTGSVSYATVSLMKDRDMPRQAPILIRVFKEEGVLEVWKQERAGHYGLLRSYEICKFSGALGPKIREGDRQAPEGFYEISAKSLNPFSRNHLAFDVGFPNAFDRSLGRTGSHLMVHGGCKSVGCYAMTHKNMEEIYGLVREALLNGQTSVPIQAFPFRMTESNMIRHADNPNMPFWVMLKQGHDMFAATGRPPRVGACPGRYVFAPAGRALDPYACEAQASLGPDRSTVADRSYAAEPNYYEPR
ncbi:murein L,D-transpeptidase family protein [Methylopila sp. 73B]|uniref:L,D-transpeptidase family protein n=1 Tax=Methylopila sp. 73B TaxID=1120792 RepID=UPI000360EADA|nr:murein L,D-transpeptidase family protein [Methylopila sp. 73B]